MNMILMTETINEVGMVSEEVDGKKHLYIEGVFMESERKNRNGRIYPKTILEREVNLYNEKYVKSNRALGELEHPKSASINPDRVSHRIVELSEEGNNFRGKALILDTPCGNIVRGIVEGGAVIGVSSRALGSVTRKNGTAVINEDLSLKTVDIVLNPSAIDAFVEMVMENEIWVPQTHIAEVQDDIRDLTAKELSRKQAIFEMVLETLVKS